MTTTTLEEKLRSKIKRLSETVWERRVQESAVNQWLSCFSLSGRDAPRDKLHALHLLAQFMYFGSKEMRALLKHLYEELYRYPVVQEVRDRLKDPSSLKEIEEEYKNELHHTRFIGLGNPSESGVHLLYYFRQEANLPKEVFIHTHNIFARGTAAGSKPGARALKEPSARHYVFIDDVCGSGDQAVEYSHQILEEMRDLGSKAKIHYYALFATQGGLDRVRRETKFDRVECIFELDDDYKVFDGARYFEPPTDGIDKAYAKDMCTEYGALLLEGEPKMYMPLGYKDGQLLVGFHHNTPNNTLPIMWSSAAALDVRWKPVFKRYGKKYQW